MAQSPDRDSTTGLVADAILAALDDEAETGAGDRRSREAWQAVDPVPYQDGWQTRYTHDVFATLGLLAGVALAS